MTLQFTPRHSRLKAKFPNAIRRYRVQRGLSQERLGKALGLDRSLVSRWERGLKLPSVPWLFKMARELGTMPEALYHDFFSPPRDDEANSPAA